MHCTRQSINVILILVYLLYNYLNMLCFLLVLVYLLYNLPKYNVLLFCYAILVKYNAFFTVIWWNWCDTTVYPDKIEISRFFVALNVHRAIQLYFREIKTNNKSNWIAVPYPQCCFWAKNSGEKSCDNVPLTKAQIFYNFKQYY